MRETRKVESCTCDWCGCSVEEGSHGLNSGRLRLPVGEGQMLELRLVRPSEKRPGQVVTQAKMDLCEHCWTNVLNVSVGPGEVDSRGEKDPG